MAKVNISNNQNLVAGRASTYNTIIYDQFKGVDFSKDPSQVARTRSPDGLNMIADDGGNPVKRKGWEVWRDTNSNSKIDNLWAYSNDEGQIIVSNTGGSLNLHKIESSVNSHCELGLPSAKRVAINVEKGLLVFCDNKLILCQSDLTTVELAKGNTTLDGSAFEPKVPTLFVSKAPSGGGTAYDSINLLTREVKETFIGDGTSNNYVVSIAVDTTKTYTAKVNGVAATIDSVTDKTFTLHTAPALGENANVEIQYFATGGTSNLAKVCDAKYVYAFAEGSSKRWFICDESTNIVRYSDLGDYTYFPDLNYMTVGSNENCVQGFLPVSSVLGVIKESSQIESTLFFISPTTLTDSSTSVDSSTGNTVTTTSERYVYKVTPGVAGIGAISNNTFAVLNDEPMFLSAQGVHGIISNTTTSEKAIRRRSLFVDGKLTNEPSLENAVACVYRGYYIVCVNTHAYILDGRQKTTDYSGNTSYSYEAYYADNIPAVSLLNLYDALYFGTADGKICKFKYTGELSDYNDNGEAINATWSTCYDSDGSPQFLKTMQKKGSSITVKPFTKSSVSVEVEVDGNYPKFIGKANVNMWEGGFENIDFNEFIFDVRQGPRDKYINKKIKKYLRMKIIAKNDVLNEPFGIFCITKSFTNVKYTK